VHARHSEDRVKSWVSVRCLAGALLCGLCAVWLPANAARASDGVGANGALGGFEARFVDVAGVRTRFYDVGAGEPMVLVHGSGFGGTASANTWSLNLAGLSQKFRVVAPDKLASGMTDNPKSDEDLTIRGEVRHLHDFVRTLKLGPIHLVGQSRGGGVALLFAVEYPELVKTLVIVDSATAAPPAGDDRGKRRERLFSGCVPQETPNADQFRCQQSALYYDPKPVSDDFVAAAAYMWRQPKAQETERRMTSAMRQRNEEVSSEMTQGAYHRILTKEVLQMPTLLYWAKNDPSVLPEQGYALYNIIAETNPRAWLLFTNRGGHFHYREHPEEFNRNVIHFVTTSRQQ
jgi:2-hydroxy-6-oxonona-2,4-dienedioate hydrolase